jgi:hypothetical protein
MDVRVRGYFNHLNFDHIGVCNLIVPPLSTIINHNPEESDVKDDTGDQVTNPSRTDPLIVITDKATCWTSHLDTYPGIAS